MAKRKIIKESWDDKLPAWTPFMKMVIDGRDCWGNSRYIVFVKYIKPEAEGHDTMIHLTIIRRDQGPDIPFRDFMRIKNEIIGPEYDFIQRFPPESSLVDVANSYHLFGFDNPDFRWPFGWKTRRVSEVELNGTKQNPWPDDDKPEDLMDEETLRKWLQKDHPDFLKG